MQSHNKNLANLKTHKISEPGREICNHCGWSYPAHQIHPRDGSGWICLACMEFLETGMDPRPWCSECGRSLPEGKSCPLHPHLGQLGQRGCDYCGEMTPRAALSFRRHSGLLCPACRDHLGEEEPVLSHVEGKVKIISHIFQEDEEP